MSPSEKLIEVHKRLLRIFGEPKVRRRTPMEVLIRTILSQNTNDNNRDRAYEQLIRKFGTFERLLDADVHEIEDAIKVGGLAKQKAAAIKRVLRWAHENYGKLDLTDICGDPDAESKLMEIKGVGVKTARVTLLFGCQADVFPIDTHIYRVFRRLGIIPWNVSREKAHELVDSMPVKGIALPLHLNVIRFGRKICNARKPQCARCPLADLCVYHSVGHT
ncbi:MAG: endonuclease III [Candidatus Hydrothermota bacterium]|nr:MAG: endonuclease III [Candidatus Hydrothermae bacterium]